VPFTFAQWRFVADPSRVNRPFVMGIRTTGNNGGDTRVTVSQDGLRFEPGDFAGCEAVLEADPGTLVLVGHRRVNAGVVRGDRSAVDRFLSLFRPL
jgi:hypothetical protein